MKRYIPIFLAFVIGFLLREPAKVSARGSMPTSKPSYMGQIGFVGERYIYVTIHSTEITWSQDRNRNVINRFSEGGTCEATFGGTMVVINDDSQNLLVRYESPGYEPNSSCPSGVTFYILREDFKKQSRTYGIRRHRFLKTQDMARKIDMRGIHGEFHPVHNGGFTFVDPANPQELNWEYTYETVPMKLGDSCIAETGSLKLPVQDRGHIEYRGSSSNGKDLYEYHPYKNAEPSVCPKGTLFFK